jgi:valyl-tRNA synthetase
MAAQGRDIRLSEDRVEGYRNFTTKLWNASRYCEMNGCLPDAAFNPETITYTPNKWIVSELIVTKQKLESALEEYRFNEAANVIYQFTWGTFCDWYLEITKPVLAGEGENAEEVRKTTGWVLSQILYMLNPFMPFVTEELHRLLAASSDSDLLITAQWPDYESLESDQDSVSEINWLTRFISEIRSVRADMNVPGGAKIRLLVKDSSEATKQRLSLYEDIICKMARLETIEQLNDEAPKGAIQTVVDEAILILPIADIIDLDKERARLEKEIGKMQEEIKKIERQLGNEKFVANAPEEIVEEQKNRKTDFLNTIEKLSTALQQLEAA